VSDLLPCPCGKTPQSLNIISLNQSKWGRVSGNCCGEWEIEFRQQYLEIDSEECKALAIEAWNSAPRFRPSSAQIVMNDQRIPTCKNSLNVAVGSSSIWLIQTPGQYDVRRTSPKELGAIEYIPAAEYNDLINWLAAGFESDGDDVV
jgi:hypothetical protein